MSGPRVAVAASGGRDSTALLHCTARLSRQLGVEVVALHVHHGLMADADAWLKQLRAQCRRWGVAFASRRLASAPSAGESVEAWARRERYRALTEMAHEQGCALVLLGHHRRDQAETFVLQALRGSGPAGLAAMPRSIERSSITWSRPWLQQPSEAVAAYARRWRVRCAVDPSNADPRFARSRLRIALWPALLHDFPDAEQSLTQAAARAHEAAALIADVVRQDLPALCAGAALHVARWQAMPAARRAPLLRAWLAAVLDGPVPDTLVQRLLREVGSARSATWPARGQCLRLYRGRLSVQAADGPASPRLSPRLSPEAGEATTMTKPDLALPGEHVLAGWSGHLLVSSALAGGVSADRLLGAQARPRSGGEQFQTAPRSTPRSLKKQYQALAVPAWLRDGPLLFAADGSLLFVPGLGIDARVRAAPGVPQRQLEWRPGASPSSRSRAAVASQSRRREP